MSIVGKCRKGVKDITKEKTMIRNKKGQVDGIIWIFLVLFVILFLGLFLAFGSLVIDWTFDEAVPILKDLGMMGSSNMTEIAGYTITPVDNVVQAFTWLAGVVYVMALVGCMGLAFAFRFTGSKWLMGFFVAGMLLLVMASIFISNTYEEFFTGTDDVATRLQEQTMLSWLILYSPLVTCIIGFISGIIMFTGEGVNDVL